MRYDFRDLFAAGPTTSLPEGWHSFASKANLIWDAKGLHLWCRNAAGTGFMITQPRQYGTWKVRSRISAGLQNPSTKVCELLWPDGGGWPPEIDFNESGDRTRSNQTVHYTDENLMHHSSYPVDQTKWHTYGVEVTPSTVRYFCDGLMKDWRPNETPGTFWNLHVRTDPHYDTESETRLDVRWIEIPDA